MKNPTVKLSSGTSKSANEALVLGFFQPEKEKEEAKKPAKKEEAPAVNFKFLGKRPKELDKLEGDLKQSKHFSGKKNEASLLRFYPFEDYKNLVVIGLGNQKNFSPEVARQSGASLNLLQRRERIPSVVVETDSVLGKVDSKDLSYYVQAFTEGYLMAGYECRDYKKEDKNAFSPEGMQLLTAKGVNDKAISAGTVLAESVNFARALGDTPGNLLTPTHLADRVAKMAKEVGLKCKVMGKAEIEKEKMGVFLGVAKGSAEEPKFIIMEHNGGKKGDKPIALVGKGITFDTGGISLKPPAKMEDMKYDMMGSAAVAGIMRSIALLGVEQNIVGVIATCENMPDGKAQKPGDVCRSRSGKTVEITNTDAEGRLILCDALEYVQDTFEPQAIIDFATLTGAVVDALGTITSGVMGNHQGLIDRIKAASDKSAERIWQLPLYDEYEDDMRSHVADIKNSGIREAGSSKGGIFLRYFVDSKYPWAHCDIAGTAYHRRDLNYHPQKYGSGVMIRLITQLLQDWKPLK